MKIIVCFATLIFGAFAQANCLNISGAYEIAHGVPECSAGVPAAKAWKKFEQQNCKSVVITKVYKLVDGSFCEGMSFTRTDDGNEVQNDGSEYASIYQIHASEHVNKVRHTTNPNMSFEIHYKLESNGNLVMQTTYANGHQNEEVNLRSQIQ